MNPTQSNLIVLNPIAGLALIGPGNARRSNKAAPGHPAFPFCAHCAFAAHQSFSDSRPFAFIRG
jgi:hypothetical protein